MNIYIIYYILILVNSFSYKALTFKAFFSGKLKKAVYSIEKSLFCLFFLGKIIYLLVYTNLRKALTL